MKQINSKYHKIRPKQVILVKYGDSWLLNRFTRFEYEEHLICTTYNGNYSYLKPYKENVSIFTFDNIFEQLWWEFKYEFGWG